jgi:myo-inositol catabolism protein IolC
MTIGFNDDLYILPFDHRATFRKKMFGWKEPLTPEQTSTITAMKQVIYDGFQRAIAEKVPREKAGILVDETFGASILADAVNKGLITACSAEKSGLNEFDFEYGEEFGKHIEALRPTFCKVLVRYNPEGNRELNRRQTARLRLLSEFLHGKSESYYMFELLVLPEPSQLEKLGGDKDRYDLELRPSLMVEAIEQLQDAGVEPDLWKIEGLDRRGDCQSVVAAARRNGRDRVGCIVLGRGEDEQKVHEWLTTAAGVDGFVGFAVGRTVFWEPLTALRDSKVSRDAAVNEISRRYAEFVEIFERARIAGGEKRVA